MKPGIGNVRESLAGSCSLLWVPLVLAGLNALAAEPIDFDKQVAPILVTRCLECHNEATSSGGLVLTNADGFRKGGESGESVVPGRPDESPLFGGPDPVGVGVTGTYTDTAGTMNGTALVGKASQIFQATLRKLADTD